MQSSTLVHEWIRLQGTCRIVDSNYRSELACKALLWYMSGLGCKARVGLWCARIWGLHSLHSRLGGGLDGEGIHIDACFKSTIQRYFSYQLYQPSPSNAP